MIPRLNIQFPLKRQWQYWFGKQYKPKKGEYLLNHARAGIVLALKAALPHGGKVGVVAYNCHTVANAVVNAGCTPVFIDVTDGMTINIDSIPEDLDAIVVTNLFGIRNNIDAIRARCTKALIIVDNAHGYGLPAEGDFTIYSINQGKFPALGEGGMLVANRNTDRNLNEKVMESYQTLPEYGFFAQAELFIKMQVKALLYSPCCYWLVRREKKKRMISPQSTINLRKMAPGVRKLYHAWLSIAREEIVAQQQNATTIREIVGKSGVSKAILVGDNAFMLVANCDDPHTLQEEFRKRGVETATHFAHAIDWAKEFGYTSGSCQKAEKMTKHLLMIPTYKKI